MKIIPLAADSMGVRSMATYVETKDCRVLIDPAANVGPFRHGLAPHPMEEWCLKKLWQRIHLFAQSADTIIITHYHPAHFIPNILDLYRAKRLLLKNPNQNIDVSQRNLAFDFINKIRGIASEVSYIDDRSMSYGDTRFIFSPPVPHNIGNRSDYFIQVVFDEMGKRFYYSSDVQGPVMEETVDFILNQNPEFMYLDGPVTYIHDKTYTKELFQKTLKRMARILEDTKVLKVILDHHLLRDLHWKDKIKILFDLARRKGIIIQTAAEFRGEENNLLEARRMQLYNGEPPQTAKAGKEDIDK